MRRFVKKCLILFIIIATSGYDTKIFFTKNYSLWYNVKKFNGGKIMFKKYLSGLLCIILLFCSIISVFALGDSENSFKTINVSGYSLTVGDVLYENNFEKETVGASPNGWSAGFSAGSGANKTSFGWSNTSAAPSLSTNVVEYSGYGKVLHVTTSSTDAYVALPCVNTLNYIYEANVIVNVSYGSLGLANNFYASTDKSSGAMFTICYPGTTSASIYRYSNGGINGTWTKSFNPKAGDKLNLKIVSFNGYNYVYYNDIHVATAPWRNVTDGSNVKDAPGFYSCNGNFYVTDVKVNSIFTNELTLTNMRTTVKANKTVAIETEFSYDKTQEIYSHYFNGDYTYNKGQDFVLGAVINVGNTDISDTLTAQTNGAVIKEFDNTLVSQNQKEINIKYAYNITAKDFEKIVSIRPFVYIEGEYYYSKGKAYSAAQLANGAYLSANSSENKAIIKELFNRCNGFTFSDNSKEITFTVFSDLHYIDGTYSSSIADLRHILNRADESDSSLILSCGDFSNDIKGSPELINTFLNHKNKDGELLLAHNVYGNHELECNNSMENVTPTLTNNKNAVWGDGTVGSQPKDLYIGYYYFEQNGFRFVCVDNCYSYNVNHKNGVEVGWEHYLKNSYGEPTAAVNATRGFDEGANAKANINIGSLGPVQMTWLEEVLLDAAEKDIPCIVVGHAGYSGLGFGGGADYDAPLVREIYKKANTANPGTVLMSLNGHIHTDNRGWRDGVLYLDVNTVRNALWAAADSEHYLPQHTYKYEKYDEQGNLISITDRPLNQLTMSRNTWFSEDPLSCVITINDSGMIIIDGVESDWMYDVVPPSADESKGQHCAITSGVIWDCEKYGHIEEYVVSGEFYHSKCTVTDCDYISSKREIPTNTVVGDCNGDGIVNTTDLAELKLMLAGLK